MSKSQQVAYNQLGGKKYARQLVSMNKNMTPEAADGYMRDSADAYAVSMMDADKGNKMLTQTNRKYKRYFGGQ